MFVNNRNHNIHKSLDHHKYLGKREYSYLAKVEVHMNKVEVVVDQVDQDQMEIKLVEQEIHLQ